MPNLKILKKSIATSSPMICLFNFLINSSSKNTRSSWKKKVCVCVLIKEH